MAYETLAPTTGIIMTAAQSGMTHIDAASEFVDNSFGAAAGDADTIVIIDAKDGTMFLDQGRGVTDINLLFRLGDGQSRNSATDIGKFGVGSKFGALTFGYDVAVMTVHNGVFHEYRVDWWDVLESGVWPRAYTGKGKSPKSAPAPIKNGGTIVLIRNLHGGRPRPTVVSYIKQLGLRFMPALENSKEIKLVRAKSIKDALAGKFKETVSIKKEFKELTDVVMKKREHHKIKIGGKAIVDVTFAELPDGDRNLSGVHVTFAGRVIKTYTNKLGDTRLPAKFFARVDLSKEYKSFLNYNKTAFTEGEDDLIKGILEVAGEILKRLTEAETTKMFEKLATDISNMMSADFGSRLSREKNGNLSKDVGEGDFDAIEPGEEDPNNNGDENVTDDPNNNVISIKTKPKKGDDHKRGGAFQFKLEPQHCGRNARAYTAVLTEENGATNCTVTLNLDVPIIETVIKNNPGNRPATLLLCLDALTDLIHTDNAMILRLFGEQEGNHVVTLPEAERANQVHDHLLKLVIDEAEKVEKVA